MAENETKYRFCLIIGAGASGLLQGAELIKQGILKHNEFEIIERNSGYGGVWWQSTYPGAACDIPSNIYQISWYPNPSTHFTRSLLTVEWTRRFSGSQEIAAYYDGFARRFNLPLCTSFNQNVIKAVWSDKEMLWTVITEERGTGKRTEWKANVVCHATGLFNRGKIPAIPGAAKFQGQAWHTADWPVNSDLSGKRVAVIGTGPSAAQVVPWIQPLVKSLTVYQRSPSWCLPRDDYAYSPFQRFLFNWVPFTHYLYCWWLGRTTSAVAFKAFRPGSGVSEVMEAVGIQHLENQVKDPVMREKLRPTGRFGCKRPLFLDDYYPALCQPNVELITDPPIEITETGIVSKPIVQLTDAEREKVQSEQQKAHSNKVIVEGLGLENYKPSTDTGERHTKVDVIIWGTGFVVQEWGTVYEIVGRGGKTLGEHWGQDCHTLYGQHLLPISYGY
jgi:cation diffusion facilitator CzcD-associated flavoprotein CzcO